MIVDAGYSWLLRQQAASTNCWAQWARNLIDALEVCDEDFLVAHVAGDADKVRCTVEIVLAISPTEWHPFDVRTKLCLVSDARGVHYDSDLAKLNAIPLAELLKAKPVNGLVDPMAEAQAEKDAMPPLPKSYAKPKAMHPLDFAQTHFGVKVPEHLRDAIEALTVSSITRELLCSRSYFTLLALGCERCRRSPHFSESTKTLRVCRRLAGCLSGARMNGEDVEHLVIVDCVLARPFHTQRSYETMFGWRKTFEPLWPRATALDPAPAAAEKQQ